MAKPFDQLRERLLSEGVAPRHVRRYLNELADHLADLIAEEERTGLSRTEAESAALKRLGGMDDLAKAMIGRMQFRSWTVRAPWATFGVAPLLVLAGAYFIALFILWSGWKMFLPGAETPFGVRVSGPIYSLENIYFQTGRMIYFGAPIFVGWCMAMVAVRQRIKITWPAIGLVLVALIGCMVQVHATGPVAAGGAGHVSLSLGLGSYFEGTLLYAAVVLFLAALPYLAWRLRSY